MTFATPLNHTNLAKNYLEPLLAGDREACRKIIDQAVSCGITPFEMLNELIWPTMELLQALYREDRISIASLNMATRLNRYITDQLTGKLDAEGGQRAQAC